MNARVLKFDIQIPHEKYRFPMKNASHKFSKLQHYIDWLSLPVKRATDEGSLPEIAQYSPYYLPLHVYCFQRINPLYFIYPYFSCPDNVPFLSHVSLKTHLNILCERYRKQYLSLHIDILIRTEE